MVSLELDALLEKSTKRRKERKQLLILNYFLNFVFAPKIPRKSDFAFKKKQSEAGLSITIYVHAHITHMIHSRRPDIFRGSQ